MEEGRSQTDGEFQFIFEARFGHLELLLNLVPANGHDLLQARLPRVKHVLQALLAALLRHPGHLSPHGPLHLLVGVELHPGEPPLECGEGPEVAWLW